MSKIGNNFTSRNGPGCQSSYPKATHLYDGIIIAKVTAHTFTYAPLIPMAIILYACTTHYAYKTKRNSPQKSFTKRKAKEKQNIFRTFAWVMATISHHSHT